MTSDDNSRLSSRRKSGTAGRHKCRPVHPECAAHGRALDACNCKKLWGHPDKLDDSLPVYRRRDMRSRWARHVGTTGRLPDTDEPVYRHADPEASKSVPAYENPLYQAEDIDGFWKESSFREQFVDSTTNLDVRRNTLDKQK